MTLHRDVLCSGQKCPERDECLRWMRQPPAHNLEWASLDLERLLLGTCEAKITPQVKFIRKHK